jgi:hypothetical protein
MSSFKIDALIHSVHDSDMWRNMAYDMAFSSSEILCLSLCKSGRGVFKYSAFHVAP